MKSLTENTFTTFSKYSLKSCLIVYGIAVIILLLLLQIYGKLNILLESVIVSRWESPLRLFEYKKHSAPSLKISLNIFTRVTL